MFGQPVNHRPQVKRGLANAARQHGEVQINAGSRQDLALTIQRQMVRIFADQHMRNGPLSGQRRINQESWHRGLAHTVSASTTRIFRAHRDNHPQLRRHDVQALCAIFANLVQSLLLRRRLRADLQGVWIG